MKSVDIKTGFLCNNNCIFCVQADNKCKGNRSFEEIKKDLEECSKTCDRVVLTGGEVTIREDFFDIVAFAKKIGYKEIQIQSNGRMFSSIQFCKKAIRSGANDFALSLHGYDSEQHDNLTNAPGSFSQITKAIKNLKYLGMKVITNTVIVKQNYKDCKKIVKYLIDLGVDQFQLAFVHGMGNAWKNFDKVIPRYVDASPYIHEGLQLGIDYGVKLMAEAMPYCMMKGYEDYVAEKIIPDTMVRGQKWQNTDDFLEQKKTSGKKKFPVCSRCKFNDVCEGVWEDYDRVYGDEEFERIIGND